MNTAMAMMNMSVMIFDFVYQTFSKKSIAL